MSDEYMAAFRLLSLPRDATQAEIEARWKRLRSRHHPDNGGNADDFDTYHTAYKAAMNAPPTCRLGLCDGSGEIRTMVKGGFGETVKTCKCKAK